MKTRGLFALCSALSAITWSSADLIAQPCNMADVAAIGGSSAEPGIPDTQLTVDDILVFTKTFTDSVGCPGESRCNLADLTGVGGPPEAPDGELTVDDLMAFVNAFSSGCPQVIVGDDAQRLIYETEVGGVLPAGEIAFGVESGGLVVSVVNTTTGAFRDLSAGRHGQPTLVLMAAHTWPEGVSGTLWSTSFTLVGTSGIYHVGGRSLVLTDGSRSTELFIPLRLFQTALEASVFASGQGIIDDVEEIIDEAFTNYRPTIANLPAGPGHYKFPPGSNRPVCGPELDCVGTCVCRFSQDVWTAQQALHLAWAQCEGISFSASLECLAAGGMFFWTGPKGMGGAYLACIAGKLYEEERCKNLARATYEAAYRAARGLYEQCMLGCGGGGVSQP